MQTEPATTSPPTAVAGAPMPRAEIGVLLVHGIGDHKEGETLISFGEPMIDWLRDWLRGQGKTDARGDVRVTEARLKATRTEAVSPAYAQVEVSLNERPGETERWLIAEAWWGDSVQAPRSLRLLTWLLTRGPLLVYWHFYLQPPDADGDRGPRRVLMAPLALALAASMQFALLVAMLLWLIPFGPWRRAVAAGVRTMTLTLGDSFVLLEQDFQSAALVRRVERALDWLGQRAERLIVIAHSQGGAIAHQALSRMKTDRVAAFISVGSGLEKLEFLRHVRHLRGGLIAANLVAPLLLIGAMTTVAGFYLDPDFRWVVGIGLMTALVGFGALGPLLAALARYERDLSARVSELDLRAALGDAEWHDLHATRDVVPMGEGSMFNGCDFVERKLVRNQHSFLNDHLTYFDNRMGFLPLLWWRLARHSGLPLLSATDEPRLRRALTLHRRRTRVLQWGALASLVALVPGLIALRQSLGDLGASVLGRLDDIGIAALVKPLHLLGRLVVWTAARIGIDHLGLDADGVGRVLLGALTLCVALLAWWVLFKAAWVVRCAADWNKAFRHPATLDASGWSATEIAGFCLWLGFGFVPLIVACLLVFVPEALTVAVLGRVVTGVLVTLGMIVAVIYSIGSPWVVAASDEVDREALAFRLFTPLVSAFLVIGALAAAGWFWPAAWGPGFIDAMTIVTGAGMALAWIVWLLWRGNAAYGLAWTGWLLVWPVLTSVASAIWDRPAGLVITLLNYNLSSLLMVTVAQAVRARGEIWTAIRKVVGLQPL